MATFATIAYSGHGCLEASLVGRSRQSLDRFQGGILGYLETLRIGPDLGFGVGFRWTFLAARRETRKGLNKVLLYDFSIGFYDSCVVGRLAFEDGCKSTNSPSFPAISARLSGPVERTIARSTRS